MSSPGTRYSRRSLLFPTNPRSPLPFRSSCDNPQDQSVRPVPRREARLTGRSIVPRSPPLPLSIPLRIDAKNSPRPSSTYRSVNPGTESIIVKERFGVKYKNDFSLHFQQLFRGLNFNQLRRPPVDSLCINRRCANMFSIVARERQAGGNQPLWWRIASGAISPGV